MNFTSNQILSQIYTSFASKYKPFTVFVKSGPLWDACVDFVKNADQMNGMIFCNDVLQIPPVKVFITINNQFNGLSDYEKKAVGAFWGFVFKFVLMYKSQRSISINKTNNIKSATYFYDVDGMVKVIL